ncbi:MAG: hypothetical protein K8R41_07370, partial [Bacteroidales bacterium]|nr:hypothetical protein [Bacteroidales bacterium]
MKILKFIKLFAFAGIALLAFSCEKNPDEPVELLDNRVFVINEGPFQVGTGTLSIIYRDSLTVENNVFEKVNDRPIGNIVQSMEVFEEKAYIVVNNANKVEIADAENLLSLGVIEDLILPRYFLGVTSEKAYVSCMDNTVAVVNLNNNTITKNIATGTGPERMLLVDYKAFVLNLGGYSVDSTISVINTDVDTVSETILLAPKPNGICEDKNGNLWVICSGNGWNGWPQAGDTEGHLFCIDPENYSILKDISFPSNTEHPEKLVINKSKDKLYYAMPNGIFEFEITATDLNLTPKVAINTMFYGLGFDEKTNYIYASDAKDFVQNGWVYRYN